MLTAGPATGGVEYIAAGRSLGFGGYIQVGPEYALELSDVDERDVVRTWAAAGPVLSYSANPWRLMASPIGAALAVGDDFGTVYPAGHAGVEYALGRVRLATLIRVVRAAGPYNTGVYWTTWAPLRVALRL